MMENSRSPTPLIVPAYNRLLPISLLAGLIGAIIGPIPAVLFTYFTGSVFYPLFVIAPLLACLFNSLLKGGRDIRALISIAVFSLLCAYITAIACRAALYILTQDISIFQIPLLVALAFGRSGVLPDSASAYAYPLVFTALGIVVTWEVLRAGSHGVQGAEDEAQEAEDGAQDADDNIQETEDSDTEPEEQYTASDDNLESQDTAGDDNPDGSNI